MKSTIRGISATMLALALIGGVFVLSGAALAAPAETAAQFTSSAPDTGRPVIILVHGRGQIPGDSVAARAEWSRALQRGAAKVGSDSLLRDNDAWVAWYADALDPLAPATCNAKPASATSTSESQSDDEQLREFFAAAGAGITAALDMIDGYAREEARALAGDLLFLGDPVRRCAAESQLENALTRAAEQNRPVILVAHSFGSLLAYRFLQSTSAIDSGAVDIHQFVTIGSLLGAPGARQLFLGDHDARASLPPGVRAWTNVVDVRDALAHPIVFDQDSATARVGNVFTSPGAPNSDPHSVTRYLTDPATARVVLGAWCEAFEVAGSAESPAGCRSLAVAR
jgi:hypothetical protein